MVGCCTMVLKVVSTQHTEGGVIRPEVGGGGAIGPEVGGGGVIGPEVGAVISKQIKTVKKRVEVK